MKFFSFILCYILFELPKIYPDQSFLQTKLKNPTQSQNGGGEQMYDRTQQAAEHMFLPFPHKMTFFEHQNPYVIFPKVQDVLKKKKEENERDEKDHGIYQQAIDDEIKKTMSAVNQKIKNSQINEIYGESNSENGKLTPENGDSKIGDSKTFEFKLNPHITSEDKNDDNMRNIISESEKLSQENEDSKIGDTIKYGATEFNKTIEKLEKNNEMTVGDQISMYNISGLNISQEVLNKNIMHHDSSTEMNVNERSEVDTEKEKLKNFEKMLDHRSKVMENENQGYKGLQSMFPENKKFVDVKNKTYYDGWINNYEIPYFDDLYMKGYYDDILKKD